MKLHRLTLSGIGPFLAQVEIDFAQLGHNGLFLLDGPTGAGKSTIIDAISFALYGKVAQTAGDGDRLRSHFAGPDTESWVELIWETQSGSYRIRRTPKYERPKRRGDGLRTINPTAALWRLGQLDDPSTGELLSTRLDEVADEITRAVGLTHAQFVQTVVLPQGEFANFLKAPSDVKRALLQKLFGTEQLARVQASLIEQRQLAERRRAGAAELLNRCVHAFIGCADLTETAEFDAALDSADTTRIAALGAHACDRLAAETVATASVRAAALAHRQQAERQLRWAEDLSHRRDRLASLRQSLHRLRDGEPAERALAAEIAAAERAAPLHPQVKALRGATERSADAAGRADIASARLPAQLRHADELTIRTESERLTRLSGSLADQVSREAELTELRAQHRRHSQRLRDADRAITGFDTELSGIESDRHTLTEQRRQLAGVADTITAAQLQHTRAAEVAAGASAAVTAKADCDAAAARAAQALADEQQANLAAHQLRQRRIEGLAGELGITLEPGQPCVVCGSCEHPNPARPAADHVSDKQVKAAETALSRFTNARTIAAEGFSEANLRWAELNARCGGVSATAAQLQLAAAIDTLDRVRAAERHLIDADAGLAEIDQRRASLTAERQEARTERELTVGRQSRCHTDIEQLEARLTDARAGFATVSERLVDIAGQLVVLDNAATELAAAGYAADVAARAATELDKALAEAGFDSEASFQLAFRTAGAVQALRAQLTDIRAEWRSTSDGLASPELADPALDADPPDLDGLAADLSAAEDHAAAAQAQFGSATDRVQQATRQLELVRTAISQAGSVIEQTAPAIRLGYLVAGLGDNQLRMDLATYVLVRRFEDIVTAANSQLRRMSNGRYLLEHSDAKQGNARSGLGLLMRDLRTDRTRDPATLSGGETFYVSLSLALGLADVVRAESGGIDLGTLFIDEGFGSLDSEVLDEVLSVLDGLRAGGRAVGVVSHVTELKARIADRIEVRPNPDGTSRMKVIA